MVREVTLKKASNGGYFVCYSEEYQSDKGVYGGMSHEYKKEAFGPDQKKKAYDRFEELCGHQEEYED